MVGASIAGLPEGHEGHKGRRGAIWMGVGSRGTGLTSMDISALLATSRLICRYLKGEIELILFYCAKLGDLGSGSCL